MQSVEWALDVALIVMQNGGSTAMADRTFQNVIKGCKQDGVTGFGEDLRAVVRKRMEAMKAGGKH
jgi:hypothetical protein